MDKKGFEPYLYWGCLICFAVGVVGTIILGVLF